MTITTRVNLLKNRRTKIVATLGPASQSPMMIKQLMEAGVNVFRLNMSHGEHDSHRSTFNIIKQQSELTGKTVAILADLCGPKIRTGKFVNGAINLEPEQKVVVTTRELEGEQGLIPSQYKELANDVVTGNRILLNDGALELRVDTVSDSEINCTVIYGGILKNHKGINLPGVNVSSPALTEKDRKDAVFAMQLGVDFLALSFVRTAADIEQLRQLIVECRADCQIVAKIEKPEALENASAIINAADAIMVARGDLGVELEAEEVPMAQRELIEMARKHFKPVIVATQMLESMIENARPTRAEVTDIAYAVTLNTDAVMLSAETAAGTFPLQAVDMMDRIARQTESHLWESNRYGSVLPTATHDSPVWSVIANATAFMSSELKVHAVIVISQTGISALTMSSARPDAPVVALTDSPATCRKMALMWGVIPVLIEPVDESKQFELARQIAKELSLASSGDYVLLVRGFNSDAKKNTPSITALMV